MVGALRDPQPAVELAETLRDAFGFVRRARSASAALGLLRPRLPRVLGAVTRDADAAQAPRSANELGARLRGVGHALALASLEGPPRGSRALAELEALVPSLRGVTPESIPSDPERIAFFVNLYNVLVLHGAVALGIERSVLEEPGFFSAVAYRVGPAVLTPDRIEHGILRRGARHFGRPSLADADPARAFLPSVVDPRVHAALVCASESCPPIAFYAAERLDAQLDLAARHFVATQVVVKGRTLHLPALFLHYAVDFGDPTRGPGGLRRGVRRFLEAHAEPTLRASIARATRVRHDPWDWRFAVRLAEAERTPTT